MNLLRKEVDELGVDTCAKLKGRILPSEIVKFIRREFKDKGVQQYTTKKTDNTNTELGYIEFTYVGEVHKIRYHYDGYFRGEDYTTFISLRFGDKSIKIIKAIVERYSGWIDENDGDDEDYYYIEKKYKGFTEEGIQGIERAKKYDSLFNYYDPYIGNFIIPEDYLKNNILTEALRFIREEKADKYKYLLLGYVKSEKYYFITEAEID